VSSEYRLQTRVKGRDVDASGLETLIVSRGAEGPWKIRHSHTSSRHRPAPSPSPATH
jgi:ketosteroid isomerase-like protein